MGLFSDFIYAKDDEEIELSNEEGLVPEKAEIVLFNSVKYDDAIKIANGIKNSQAVCFNTSKMAPEAKQRLVDFVTGTVYGVDGTINQVDDNVFLASPKVLTVDKSED